MSFHHVQPRHPRPLLLLTITTTKTYRLTRDRRCLHPSHRRNPCHLVRVVAVLTSRRSPCCANSTVHTVHAWLDWRSAGCDRSRASSNHDGKRWNRKIPARHRMFCILCGNAGWSLFLYRGRDLGNPLGSIAKEFGHLHPASLMFCFLAVFCWKNTFVMDTPTQPPTNPCETGLARVCLILNPRVA